MEKENIAKDNHCISDQSVKPISDSQKNLEDNNLFISHTKSTARNVLSLKIGRNKAEKNDSVEQGKNADNRKGNFHNSKDLSPNEHDSNSEVAAKVKVTKTMGGRETPFSDSPSQSLDSVRDSEGIIELDSVRDSEGIIELDSVRDSEGIIELDSVRDSEGIIELSLGGSSESIESTQETSGEAEDNEVLTTAGDSEKRNSLSKTNPFFKIIDVTSIDLDAYNSDSSNNPVGNTDTSNQTVIETDSLEHPVRNKTKVVEYASPFSEESKSRNKITSLFGKVDKISNFLSGRVEQNSKQSCSSSKQKDSIPQHAQNNVLKKSKVKVTESENAVSSLSYLQASNKEKKQSKLFNKEKWNRDFVKKSFCKVKGKLSLVKKNISDSESSDEGDDIQIIQEENMDRDSKKKEEIIVLSDSD